jgi:hypothetical protein
MKRFVIKFELTDLKGRGHFGDIGFDGKIRLDSG